jgi:tetratricopeptide (TPR) repeat protein
MLQNLGQHEKALEHLSKAIELKSTCPATHFNYAKSLRAQGKLEQALDIYNKAINLKPDYFEAYNNRGSLLEDLQRHEEARESYTDSIRLKFDYALAYSNRARVQKKIGNYEGAMEDFTKAIEFGNWKNNASDQNLKSRLYVNLGDILMFFRNYAKALAAYNEALNIEPDNQNLIGMKGNAIVALGDIEEGLKLKQQGYGVVSFDSLQGVSINHGRS